MRRTNEEKVDVQTRQRAVDTALRARGIDVGLAWWQIVEQLMGPRFLLVPNLPTDAEAEALVDAFMKDARAGKGSPIVPLDTTTEKPRCPDCGLLTPHPALEAGDTIYTEAEYNIICAGCGGLYQAQAAFRWTTTMDPCVKLVADEDGEANCVDADGVYYEHGELA